MLLNRYHVQISMVTQDESEESGYTERLMRTIMESFLTIMTLRMLTGTADWTIHQGSVQDQADPLHSALGYLTRVEFEIIWRVSQPAQTTPY